jgi:hypothetical protein
LLKLVAFTTTDEDDVILPVPVGPIVGDVAFPVIENPVLACVVVVAFVIGAEWVWIVVVPFSVHSVVYVV